MRFFFLDGETSFDGLGGASGGVLGREIGGAFRGERCFVGVGELDGVSCGTLSNGRDQLDEYSFTVT